MFSENIRPMHQKNSNSFIFKFPTQATSQQTKTNMDNNYENKDQARQEAVDFMAWGLKIVFEEIEKTDFRRKPLTRTGLLKFGIKVANSKLKKLRGEDLFDKEKEKRQEILEKRMKVMMDFDEVLQDEGKSTPKRKIKPEIVPPAPKKAKKLANPLFCDETISD
jgi:hypothetical protein